MSKIQGHKNPFGKAVRDMTVLELDFILEMEAKDNPDRLTFTRAGRILVTKAEELAAWSDVLTGPALRRFLTGKWRPDIVQRWRDRSKSGMVPGVTRGGKVIEDAGRHDDGER